MASPLCHLQTEELLSKWEIRRWLPKKPVARDAMRSELKAAFRRVAQFAAERCAHACQQDHSTAVVIGRSDDAVCAKSLERQCRSIAKEYQ